MFPVFPGGERAGSVSPSLPFHFLSFSLDCHLQDSAWSLSLNITITTQAQQGPRLDALKHRDTERATATFLKYFLNGETVITADG